MDKIHDSHQTHLAAACLLLSIAEADEILQQNELNTICDILKDFFSLTNNESSKSSTVEIDGSSTVFPISMAAAEILRESGAATVIPPEAPKLLSEKIIQLSSNPKACHEMGKTGKNFVEKYYNRHGLAGRYLEIMESSIQQGKFVEQHAKG